MERAFRPAINDYIGVGFGGSSLGNASLAKPIRSQIITLDSPYKDPTSSLETPNYILPQTIECQPDEYMTLTLQRANFYNDFHSIPEGSQIRFTKLGGTPMVITLARYGMLLIGNLATAIYNAYHTPSGDMGFNITYDTSLGVYKLTFGTASTMEILTPDLAKYMSMELNLIYHTVDNVIYSGVVRPQKTINIAIEIDNLSSHKPAVVCGQSRNVLCVVPVLSASYILANYRPYIEGEGVMRITNTSFNHLQFEFIDTYSGSNVPMKESHLCIQVDTYKK